MKDKNTQLNIIIPSSWKSFLEKESRKVSFNEDKTISVNEMIRQLLKKEYNLDGNI